MPHIRNFLLVSVLLAACGGRPKPAATPAPEPAPDVNAVTEPAPEPAAHPDTRWAGPRADYAAVFEGLIHVSSIAELPGPSYAARNFQLGVFDDAAAWAEFTRAADIDPFGPVDWTRQAVVYVVLDERTNLLGLEAFEADNGVANLQILWVGIEPQWDEQSPAVLTLVERESLQQIRISAGELPLGSVVI